MENFSMDNKTILFTGATSGLGKVAALEAVNRGARVIALYRDRSKGEELQRVLQVQFPSAKGSLDLIECNFSSLDSIVSACNRIKESVNQLDIIVNNAGTWNFKFSETEDGIENTLQVNFLAPILIINMLMDLIKKAENPKVINTASGLYQGSINFQDIEFHENFSGFKAYRQSKLGIILITRYYQYKFGDQGVQFYSQHPGLVDTDLVRKGNWISKQFFKLFGKSPEKGAETLIHLMQTPVDKLKGGEFYSNCKVTKTLTKESNNLKVAEKLNSICLGYLNNYIQN